MLNVDPAGGHGGARGERSDWRGLLELASDAVVVTDASGSIVLVNAPAERLFGYSREEMLGRGPELLVPTWERAGGGGLRLFGRHRDGSRIPLELAFSLIETHNGTYIASAMRRSTPAADAQHFVAVVASCHDAIVSLTLDGTITSWNDGAERLYGYGAGEALGRSVAMLVPPGHGDEQPEILRRIRAGERVEHYETVRCHRDGSHVPVSLSVSPIRDGDGAIVGASAIARDIGERLRQHEQLRFLAEHDPLTGALNRRRFERATGEQLARARRHGERAALLFIDVDNLKAINDRHGHGAGDRALRTIARAISDRLRNTDVLARIGGDEFAVLLPHAGEQQGRAVAGALRRAIASSRFERGIELSVSIGVARIDERSGSPARVLARADAAMYRAKAQRPDSVCFDLPIRAARGTAMVVETAASAGPPAPR